jgi:hypothetical protein
MTSACLIPEDLPMRFAKGVILSAGRGDEGWLRLEASALREGLDVLMSIRYHASSLATVAHPELTLREPQILAGTSTARCQLRANRLFDGRGP